MALSLVLGFSGRTWSLLRDHYVPSTKTVIYMCQAALDQTQLDFGLKNIKYNWIKAGQNPVKIHDLQNWICLNSPYVTLLLAKFGANIPLWLSCNFTMVLIQFCVIPTVQWWEETHHYPALNKTSFGFYWVLNAGNGSYWMKSATPEIYFRAPPCL